jgi:CheY-like chemotaxis protein
MNVSIISPHDQKWWMAGRASLKKDARIVGMLEDAGFRMIQAVSSDEALELLTVDSDVQRLFTDVNTPGTIDGLALARQVHDRWPHIGIMVASAKQLPEPKELPVGFRFEQKPYSPETVVRHGRELTSA